MKAYMCIILAIICIFSATCTQAKMSIRSMYDGSQVIELAEIRQLTTLDDGIVEGAEFSPDGKSIAYASSIISRTVDPDSYESRARIVAVSPSGGRPTVLLDTTLSANGVIPQGKDVIVPGGLTQFAWSPDSRLIALEVSVCRDTIENQWQAILMVNRNGSRRGLIDLPRNVFMIGRFAWSPNGRKIAVLVQNPRKDPKERPAKTLVLFDTVSNASPIAVNTPDNIIDFEKFTDDGKGLICLMHQDKKAPARVEVSISGEPMTMLEEKISADRISPDGVFKLIESTQPPQAAKRKPGIIIEQISDKKEIPLIPGSDFNFIGWSPDSKMISLWKNMFIEDAAGSRRESLPALWIGLTQEGKYNHMYVTSLDTMPNGYPQMKWSNDGWTLAYISQDHLYTVRLTARPPDVKEKRDLGIPLTEEEMKIALLSNSKQIGTSLQMYAQDNDGKLPDAATFERDLTPYSRNNDIFRSPNGGADLYDYFPQANLNGIANPAETVLLTMDAGYGWQVETYADGHVRAVPKD